MAKKKFSLLGNGIFNISIFDKFYFTKRQRFIISIIILSFGLFFSEQFFGKSGFLITLFLSLLSSLLFFFSIRDELKGNRSLYVYLFPLFFYTLATGLFYFLTPPRFLSRFLMTVIYAVGLYSLYLSQNIFIVASLRTIPLLSGARIVSLATTLISYYFLITVILTLHLSVYISSLFIFLFSFMAAFQSIAVTFEKSIIKTINWVTVLALCLFELSIVLWFWPSTPTLISLFLTGIFYTIIGLSHAWFDRRLFRGVMWEYIWVGALVFFMLIFFTPWRG
ncbi:MAG: hypothetical protein NTZ20_02650 [Candidatus Levybacteria bacterium]|nr:hypothetical protein [Candidatus Levybacteria bacterium]MSU25963.1 hypothetical protein [Candidatus Levybacteria bacterium]